MIEELKETEIKEKNMKKEKNEVKEDAESNGSDSEPSCDNLDNEVLYGLLPNFKKKKKKKEKIPIQIRIKIKIKNEPIKKYISPSKVFNKPMIINITKSSERIIKVTPKIIEKEHILIDSNKKNEETQTEDIFFKM